MGDRAAHTPLVRGDARPRHPLRPSSTKAVRLMPGVGEVLCTLIPLPVILSSRPFSLSAFSGRHRYSVAVPGYFVGARAAHTPLLRRSRPNRTRPLRSRVRFGLLLLLWGRSSVARPPHPPGDLLSLFVASQMAEKKRPPFRVALHQVKYSSMSFSLGSACGSSHTLCLRPHSWTSLFRSRPLF